MNKHLATGLLAACFLTPAIAQAQGADGTLSELLLPRHREQMARCPNWPDSWTMSASHAVSLNRCFTGHSVGQLRGV